MKYRRKSLIVDAIQWDGSMAAMAALKALIPGCGFEVATDNSVVVHLPNSEYRVFAYKGGYIGRNENGHLFTLSASQFASVYEVVDSPKRTQEVRGDVSAER